MRIMNKHIEYRQGRVGKRKKERERGRETGIQASMVIGIPTPGSLDGMLHLQIGYRHHGQ